MKRSLLYYTCLYLLAIIHSTVFAAPDPHSLSAGNLQFTENKGQITDQHYNSRPDIHFKIAAGKSLNIFIGSGQIHYQWSQAMDNEQWAGDNDPSILNPRHPERSEGTSSLTTYRMDVTLLNANPSAEVITEDKQPFYEQYYTHLTGENGIRAYSYKKITYREVYPHIDWVFYINATGQVEHDFVVRPGGKVSDIRLQYAGAAAMHLNPDGSVTATTPFGSVTENTPYCFQQDGRTVPGRFVLTDNTLSFSTAAYEGTLTIDPVLEWGTYFGGSETDRAEDVATDRYGNVYITGRTNSTANIATTGAHQNTFAGGTQELGAEAFLAKFSRSGACLWATYYGGDRVDVAKRISCDTAGNVYMAGYTSSASGIATNGTHQTAKAGTAASFDAFLARFDTAGSRIWGTYFGGTGADGNTTIDVACDQSDNIYLTGNTQSASGIATANGYITARPGGHDMFLAKFKEDGTIDWSTYYGGSSNDYGSCLAVDKENNITVAGYTQSVSDIALPGNYRTTLAGARDVFLVKFGNAGQPVWATYYGGAQDEHPTDIAIDNEGNAIISGVTYSDTGIATPGNFQTIIAEQVYGDGFCAKFSKHGLLQWGTYYGGNKNDEIYSVAIGGDDMIYLGGVTRSASGITTPDGYQPDMISTQPDISSGLIVKLDPGGQRIWGTYYGGIDHDEIYGIAADDRNNIYIAGITSSGSHIATADGYQTAPGGGLDDAFLVRFNDCTPPATPDTISGAVLVCFGVETIYRVPPAVDTPSYTWLIPAGWIGQSSADTILIIPSDTAGQIHVVAHSACGGNSDTQSLRVSVSPIPVIVPAGTHDICAGDTLLLNAVPDTAGVYTWLKDNSAIPGSDKVIFPVTAGGSYRVILDNGVCTDTSDGILVRKHNLPTPEIVNNNGILATTKTYETYQWYYNEEPVTGAENATFTANAPGRYAVMVSDSNSCKGMSEEVAIGDTRVANFSNNNTAVIYPNPAGSHLVIHTQVNAVLQVYTITGIGMVSDLWIPAGIMHLDLSQWSAGLYRVQLNDLNGNILLQQKLIKQ